MPIISARVASFREKPQELAAISGGALDPFSYFASLADFSANGQEDSSRAVASAGESLGLQDLNANCLGMFAVTKEALSAAPLLEQDALWELFAQGLDAADAGALKSSPFGGVARRAFADALEKALAPASAVGKSGQALAYLTATLYLARPRDFLSLDGPMRSFLASQDGLGIDEGDLPTSAMDYVGLLQYLSGQMEGATLPYEDFAQMGRAVALGLPLSSGLAAPDREALVRQAIRPELCRLWPSDERLADAACERLQAPEGQSAQVALSKRQLRKLLRRLRSSLAPESREKADTKIADVVLAQPEWRSAKTIFSYLSFGAEVDTRRLIEQAWQDGKAVALPRVVPNTRDMRWFAVTSFDGLETSSMGVDEPPIDPTRELDPSQDPTALALVPGLAFDGNGYRVGYGGGFYDTFLSGFPGHSVGLCRGVTLMEDLLPLGVLEPHDLAVQVVATDAKKVFGRAINS
ncbi:5-formyltetrahydrofolate cyclo-ligase [Tractidigestivibacter sp.]|uniref:5-formyltetrahydrofolate cyclo-ligase n=1 Tax=Tractidigestivibacter sp. TaxID=2847320 RepID=UPI003D8BECCF